MTGPRRVLIFAYFFPPLGGAGVQRIVKFAKYLPDEGWLPTVVTVGARDYWMSDPSLAAELGPDVRVVRTRSLTGLTILRRFAPREGGRRASNGAMRRLRGLSAWFLLPDSYAGWVPFARRAGEGLLRAERFDALLTTSSPDSAHLIGRALARRHAIPWVADFRDPWTRRLSFAPPSGWHLRRHLALEGSVLREASLVTVTAEATRRDYLACNPWLPAGKVQVVTNGYDEADFASLAGEGPGRDRLRILHAGQLNPERPARPFLAGLRLFLERRPAARERVRVDFIGPHYAGDLLDARRMGLEGVVRFLPGLPHGEVVRELLRSHVLLLMEEESERGGLILPGKIFEYLRAGRPILGLLPRGAAWDLIEAMGAGRCCRTGDAEACAAALEAYDEAFRRGGPEPVGIDPARLAGFERRALTHRLAGLLDGLRADRPPSAKNLPLS